MFLAGFAGDAAVRFVPFFCRHVDVEVFSQHRVQPCFAAQIISFAGFACDDAFRAVLPSLSTRSWPRSSPTLSVACAWLGFVGDDSIHAVFPVVVCRPVMLGIMAVFTLFLVVFLWEMTSGLSPYSALSLFDSGYMRCVSLRGFLEACFFFWEMTSGLFPYSALSLVRQRIHAVRQSTRLSERISHNFSWFLGDYFKIVSVFSASLGSTMDTCLRQSRRFLEDFHTFWTFVFQHNAWLDSGFLLIRQTTQALTGTGRFPWSCCSAGHGDSTIAALERGDRCSC